MSDGLEPQKERIDVHEKDMDYIWRGRISAIPGSQQYHSILRLITCILQGPILLPELDHVYVLRNLHVDILG